MSADRPNQTSTALDGTAALMEDDVFANKNKTQAAKKRERLEDENDMGEKTFQRLRQLESLFGCSATVKVAKA